MNLSKEEKFVLLIVIASFIMGAGYQLANYYISSQKIYILRDINKKNKSVINTFELTTKTLIKNLEKKFYKELSKLQSHFFIQQKSSKVAFKKLFDKLELLNKTSKTPFTISHKLENVAKAVDIGKSLPLPSELGSSSKRPTHKNNLSTFISQIAMVKKSENSENLSGQTNQFPVNINTAKVEELQKLKGVGKVLARKIVLYRKLYGPFKSIKDLKNVRGIGEKKFESLKSKIIVKKITNYKEKNLYDFKSDFRTLIKRNLL